MGGRRSGDILLLDVQRLDGRLLLAHRVGKGLRRRGVGVDLHRD
jgi:hypothetical protein